MIEIYAVTALVLAMIFMIMSAEDWNHTTVAEVWCMLCWVVLSAVVIYSVPNRLCLGVLIAGMLIYGCRYDVPMFGDADIIPVVSYVCLLLCAGVSFWYWYLGPTVLLLCLVPYGKLYGRLHGFVWHFGDNKPVPALPVFTVAWLITLVCFSVMYYLGVR